MRRIIRDSLAVAALAALALSACGDDAVQPLSDGGLDTQPRADSALSDALFADTWLPGPDQGAADASWPDAGKPYLYQSVSVQQAWKLIQAKTYTLLDVREPAELTVDGYIAGAINLPYTSGGLSSGHNKLKKGKGIVVYCRSGNRSSKSAPFLVGKGFKPVYNVLGGFTAWKTAGLPWTK